MSILLRAGQGSISSGSSSTVEPFKCYQSSSTGLEVVPPRSHSSDADELVHKTRERCNRNSVAILHAHSGFPSSPILPQYRFCHTQMMRVCLPRVEEIGMVLSPPATSSAHRLAFRSLVSFSLRPSPSPSPFPSLSRDRRITIRSSKRQQSSFGGSEAHSFFSSRSFW